MLVHIIFTRFFFGFILFCRLLYVHFMILTCFGFIWQMYISQCHIHYHEHSVFCNEWRTNLMSWTTAGLFLNQMFNIPVSTFTWVKIVILSRESPQSFFKLMANVLNMYTFDYWKNFELEIKCSYIYTRHCAFFPWAIWSREFNHFIYDTHSVGNLQVQQNCSSCSSEPYLSLSFLVSRYFFH